MSKLKVRPIHIAAVAGAIVGAAIGIPAWAASDGGGSSDRSAVRPAPLPLPGRGAGFALGAKGAASAADAKQMRKELDEFASCMREQGAEVPGVHLSGHGASIQLPDSQSRAVMRKVAEECGMPPPPPRDEVFPLTKKQIEKNREAIGRGDCPLPPLPRHK